MTWRLAIEWKRGRAEPQGADELIREPVNASTTHAAQKARGRRRGPHVGCSAGCFVPGDFSHVRNASTATKMTACQATRDP